MARTFLPSQTPIRHSYYTLSGVDAHGNPVVAYSDPVEEWAICFWPLERKTWETDDLSPDTVARLESDVHLIVDNAANFTKGDRVELDLSGDPSIRNWTMFVVQGLSTDWSAGLPFPTIAYGSLVGGEIHLRRVTSTGVLAGQ